MQCDICGKEYVSKAALAGHMYVHSPKFGQIPHEKRLKRIEAYIAHPKLCLECEKPLPYDKKANQFCSHTCAAAYTNKKRGLVKKEKRTCKFCGKEINPPKTFCDQKCMGAFKTKECQDYWLKTGKFPNYTGGVYGGANRAAYVVSYLLVRQKNTCDLCHQPFMWFEKPLPNILDHKDGDATNNHPDNLRLLCPNCEATTSTWKGRNKGSGRKSKGFMLPQQRDSNDD